jgi:hypothetical protein
MIQRALARAGAQISNLKKADPQTMKHLFSSILILASLALTPIVARAQLGTPQYYTVGPSVQGTSSSLTYVPALDSLTPRIVGVNVDSDKAASVFSFKKGVGAYTVGTNTAAGTALNLQSGVGLANSDTLVIQTATGNITNCTVSSIANVTNITISITPAFGFTNGDMVYKMSSATTFGAGAKSNNYVAGEAVFVGNRGRPVMLTIDGTSWSIINAISYRQE